VIHKHDLFIQVYLQSSLGRLGFFSHKRIMHLKLITTGSQKSYGVVLAARDY